MNALVAASVGAVAGLGVGATSTGGGALLTPGLNLIVGVPPSIAIGTDVAIAMLLIIAGVTGLVRLFVPSKAAVSAGPGPVTAAILGFLTGLLVTITSVGSGSLLLAVLSLFFPMAAVQLVGTDIVHALLLTTVASAGHMLAGRVDFALAGWVLLGSVPGVLIGTRMATAVPERWLRGGLATALILLALQLLTTGKA